VLIAIFALLAGLIVYRVAKVQMGGNAALIYFLLYWLSPWRLTHAAMMWEPAFLFLPAALHLWAVSRLTPQSSLPAGRGGLWPSIVLGGVLLLTPQLHGSFLFLWLLTAILIYKKEIRLDWRGAALGAAIGSLTLIPAIYAAATGNFPAVLPQEGFIGKGFVTVWPLFKGALYWLRLASLDCGGLKEVVYFEPGWAQAFWQHASVILLRVLQALTVATIACSVLAAWWYFKKRKASGEASGRTTWFERYAWYALVALVLSAGFSPVTLQGWHVTIALHAALIPLAVWAANQLRTNRRRVVWFGLYLAVGLSSVLAIGLGKGAFRQVALPHEVETSPAVRILLPATLPVEAK
jgi:hypothetical protein